LCDGNKDIFLNYLLMEAIFLYYYSFVLSSVASWPVSDYLPTLEPSHFEDCRLHYCMILRTTETNSRRKTPPKQQHSIRVELLAYYIFAM
jgi:hypothetical protein